jgi:hypothetical protein
MEKISRFKTDKNELLKALTLNNKTTTYEKNHSIFSP